MNKKQEPKEIKLNGKPFEVPPGGSLGVLALGNIGVRAWKKAKEKFEKKEVPGNEK